LSVVLGTLIITIAFIALLVELLAVVVVVPALAAFAVPAE
jgi:hypothetical protein